jgi:nucleoid DNA-binding protein
MNKSKLISILAGKTGMTKSVSSSAVETIFEEITNTLEQGWPVDGGKQLGDYVGVK